MALSGTFYGSTVDNGYRLEIDWSATQDITNNKSTVTAKVYWHSLGSSYTVSSSATKTGSTTINDGTAHTSSWSTAGASLSGNQRKLVNTYSYTVTHDSTGNKSVTISATYNVAVTLGSYVSSVSASGTATLNQIPRETTLSSGQSWTAGNAITLNFDKKNSSYTTNVDIKVNSVLVKTITGITGSSYSYTFSASENEDIFQQLALDTTSFNQSSTIVVTTKSGSTTIGSAKTYTGTVSSPANTQVSGSSFTVGDSTTITLSSEQNSSFVYDLTAKVGTYTKTILSKAGLSSPAWDTNADKTSILGQMPSNTATVTYTLTTYWANGTSYTKVKSADTYTVTASVNTSTEAPTFTGGVTYADTNSTITAVTGSSAYIVQNKSTMTVTLASGSLATAKTGTTMKEYQCTFNGKTITVAHPATATNLTFTFNATDLNVSTNQNIVMKAVDNRTNSTSVTVSVNVVPYAPPTVTATATRDDGFSDPSTLTLSGTISLLSVAGVTKNDVVSIKYQYRASGGTYNTAITMTEATATLPAYKANNVTLATQLTNTSAWDVQFTVTDKLGSTVVVKTVGIGQPIFFMDSVKKSVGVGMFPTISGSFEVTGVLRMNGSAGSYINFNNSALVANDNSANGGTNGTNYDHIWHDDSSNTWHFVSDETWKHEGNSVISSGALKVNHSGGQKLSLNDSSYVAGTTGMYNYMGFNDGAGTYQAYLGFGSGRDNIFNVYNKIGDVKITSSIGDITLSPASGHNIVMTNILDMKNSNITNINNLQISDIGPSEGVEWLSASGLNNWKIHVTDDNASSSTGNSDTSQYPLQFFRNGVRMVTIGTGGTIYATGDIYAQNNGAIMGNIQHQVGYMIVKPYDSTYGTGHGRIWYDSNNNMFRFWNQANGNATLSSANTSKREYKTDILEVSESALDKINSAPVYEYFYKRDTEIWKPLDANDDQSEWVFTGQYKDKSTMKKKRGIMVEDAPTEIVVGDDTIDLYGMSSILWKAVQELSSRVESLNEKIKRR